LLATDTFSILNVFDSVLILASVPFNTIFVIYSSVKFQETSIVSEDTFASSDKLVKLSNLFPVEIVFVDHVQVLSSSSFNHK